MASLNYAEIAVFRPIRTTFEYTVPDCLKGDISVGSICRVPFRGDRVRGVVLEVKQKPDYDGKQKEITGIITEDPLPDPVLDLAGWLSYTTLTPIGQVVNRFVPGDLSVQPKTLDKVKLKSSFNGVRDFIEQNKSRAPKQVELLEYLLAVDGPIEKTKLLRKANSSRSPLKALEEKSILEIVSSPEIESSEEDITAELSSSREPVLPTGEELGPVSGGYSQYVVNGPANRRLGNYLEAIRRFAGEGAVLVIAPNVIRSEELRKLIRERLGLKALSYHSQLTKGEVSSRWNLARTEKVDAFTGVLSAMYLPLSNLKAIIVDGDGERNYDLTEQDPKGNLIETARRRAELENVPLLVGGTAPSISTYYRIDRGEAESIGSNFRIDRCGKVDLALQAANRKVLSSGLKDALKRSMDEEGPALIVGSQTGAYSAAICEQCGEVVRCSDCKVPLSFTGSGSPGVCPYCGAKRNLLVCENCGSDDLKFIGSGLEKAAGEVRSLLPEAKVRRYDSQEETWRDFLELAGRVLAGDVDVLLGTSLVESPYFEGKSSLIGLLDLDLVKNRPSYRSTEFLLQRVFAGFELARKGGEVFLQVRDEGGWLFDFIKARDWGGLYENELNSRRRMGYPPFSKLIKIEVERGKEEEARNVARELKEELTSLEGDFQVLGPTSNIYERRKERYRSDLIVKAEEPENILDHLNSMVAKERYREVRLNPFA